MLQFLLLIFLSFSFLGCNTQPNITSHDQVRTKDTSRPRKGIIRLVGSEDCDISTPDSSIYGIKLNDTGSVLKVIGINYKLIENGSQDLPYISFVNNNGKERIFLLVHYASPKYEFSEFEVKKLDNDIGNLQKINVEHFITGFGVHIGMTKKEVIAKLGNCYESMRDYKEKYKLYYRIDNIEKSAFLKRYKMPIYYGSYVFKNEILSTFRFGFEYP